MTESKKYNSAEEGFDQPADTERRRWYGFLFRRRKRAPDAQKETRSLAYRATRNIALFLLGSSAALVAALLILQTGWGTDRIRSMVEQRVNGMLNGAMFEVGHLDGNLLSAVKLSDLRLLSEDGLTLARVDTVSAEYRLFPLLFGRLHMTDIDIIAPTVSMHQLPDSTWDLMSVLSTSSAEEPDSTADGMVIQMDNISLRAGRMYASFYASGRDSSFHLIDAVANVSGLYFDTELRATLDTLRAEFESPLTAGIVMVGLGGAVSGERLDVSGIRLQSEKSFVTGAGTIVLPSDSTGTDDPTQQSTRFALVAQPLSFADIHMFASTLNPAVSLDAELEIEATGNQMDALGRADFSNGGHLELSAGMTLPGSETVQYRADMTVHQLDMDAFTGLGSWADVLDGELEVELNGRSLDELGGGFTFAISRSKRARPMVDQASASGTFTQGRMDIDLAAVWAGAHLDVIGTARPFDVVPAYDVEVDLRGFEPAKFLSESTVEADVNARLSIAGTGFRPESADAEMDITILSSTVQRIAITEANLVASLSDGRLRFDSSAELAGGTVDWDGEASLSGAPSLEASHGRFANIDVAYVTEDTTSTRLNGTFSISASGTDANDLELQAEFMLHESTYGAVLIPEIIGAGGIERGVLDVNLSGRLGEGAFFEIAGNVRPFEDGYPFVVDRSTFSTIDLGKLIDNESISTDLNGEMTARGRGTSLDEFRLEGDVRLQESRVNLQTIESGTARLTLEKGTLSVATELGWSEGGVRFAATIDPFSERPTFNVEEGSLEELDAGALLGNDQLKTQLSGTFSARGTGLGLAEMELSTGLVINRSRINHVEMQSGVLSLQLLDGRADFDAKASFDSGELSVTGGGLFTDHASVFNLTGNIGNLDIAALAGMDSVRSNMSLTFAMEGEGLDPESMRLEGQVRMHPSAIAALQVDSLLFRFDASGGVLNAREFTLGSNVLNASGSGPVALFDTTHTVPSNFLLLARITDLEPMRRQLDASALSLTSGSLTASVRGTSDQLRFDLGVSGSSFVYNDLHFSDLNVGASGVLTEERTVQEAIGTLEVELISMPNFEVEMTSIEADFDGEVVSFDGSIRFDPRRSAGFSGQLERIDDATELHLQSATLLLDGDEWRLRAPSTLRFGETYMLGNTVLSAGTQQLVLAGAIDPKGVQNAFFRATNVRIGPLAEWMGFDRLGGTLNSSLVLTGSAAQPRLAGSLGFDILSSGNRVGDVRMSLLYDSLRVKVDGAIDDRNGSTMSVLGYVPVDLRLAPSEEEILPPDEGIVFNIEANASSLTWIRPFIDREFADVRRGTLTVDADISGTLQEPVLSGTILIDDAAVHLPEFGITYENIGIQSTMQNNEMLIESATMTSGGGTLAAVGSIEFASLLNSTFKLDLTANNFRAVENELYRSTVSGEFTLSGRTTEPQLAGQMRLSNTDIFLSDYAGGDVEQVSLKLEDERMLEDIFGYRVTEIDTLSLDFYRSMAMNLNVRLERDTWIRQRANPKMAIELTGRLDIQKESNTEDVLLFQSIDVVPQRSYIEQFGRRFDITNGTVSFNGPLTEMVMDIDARYEVLSRLNPGEPEATITLSLSGRIDDLQLELGSDPAMDNTDIVSYIATGRPASQSLQFGGLDQTGGVLGLAAGQLAGVIEGVAGENLGLDVIEIQQDGLKGTQLTAGKYLTGRTYVGISQPISFGGQGTSRANEAREVTLEYKVFEWLLLQLLGETNTSAVRLNLTGRYAF